MNLVNKHIRFFGFVLVGNNEIIEVFGSPNGRKGQVFLVNV